MSLISMLLAAAIGAAMMFFMDPKTGKERREQLRDQSEKLKSKVNQYTETAMDEASETAREVTKKARNTAEKVRDDADEMLERLQQDQKS